MKSCPQCGTQYTDDTLRFCLQDGSPLVGAPVTQQVTESLSGAEMETAVRPRRTDRSVETQWAGDREATTPQPGTRSRGLSTAAIAAGVILLVIGAAAAGAFGLWLYFRLPGRENAVVNKNGKPNSNLTVRNANTDPTPLPSATPSPTATGTPNVRNSPDVYATPAVDKAAAVDEISDTVAAWKEAAESGDLESQMRAYAPTVDYYRKRGANHAFIRADRARAYRMFDSISLSIDNMKVTVDDSGETATADFDKQWEFDGERRSTGKVRQQLQFRKLGGEWLITSERDLSVYYTN